MDGHTRHRLIGLALLLLLAAIVTPIIFRSPEQVRVALDMDIPEPPELTEVPLTAVVTEDELEQAQEQIDEAREQVIEAGEKRLAEPAVAQPAPLKLEETPSGCSVQVVALSSQEAAVELEQRLRDAEYSAYTRKVSTDGQSLYRVFVGPELERARCDDLKTRLSRDIRFKLDGLVVPYAL